MSDELTASGLAGAAEAEESREQEVPSEARAAELNHSRDGQGAVDESPNTNHVRDLVTDADPPHVAGTEPPADPVALTREETEAVVDPIVSEHDAAAAEEGAASERTAETFAEWTEQAMTAETDAFAAAEASGAARAGVPPGEVVEPTSLSEFGEHLAAPSTGTADPTEPTVEAAEANVAAQSGEPPVGDIEDYGEQLPAASTAAPEATEPTLETAEANGVAQATPDAPRPADALEGRESAPPESTAQESADSDASSEQTPAPAESAEATSQSEGQDFFTSETADGGSPDIPEGVVELVASGADTETARIKAIIEAVIYITDEPLSAQQIAQACGKPIDEVKRILDQLSDEYSQPDRGLTIRELAGGYKMSTKPEHHEEIRAFVKNLKPPLKLSLAALETLAVIAYKQPITAPEIMEIRGVQGAGVLKTLLDRKLIATAGRKNVIGKPILYKTTREFLVQFGLKDLTELPTLKEFEELGRLELTEAAPETPVPVAAAAAAPVHEPGHTPAEPAQDPESAPVDGSGAVEAVGEESAADAEEAAPETSAPVAAAAPAPVREPGHTPAEPAQDPESAPVDGSGAVEAVGEESAPDPEEAPPETSAPVAAAAAAPVREPGHTPAEPAQDPESALVDGSGAVEAVGHASATDAEQVPVQEPGPEPPPIEEPPAPPAEPEPEPQPEPPVETEPKEQNG